MTNAKTLYNAKGAFVNQGQPNVNLDYDRLRMLRLKATGSTDERRAFVWFKMPFEVSKQEVNSNIVVVSATLRLRTRSAWAAASTITAKRVTEGWKETTISWSNQPAVGSGSAVSPAFSGADTVVDIDVTSLVSEAVTNKGWYGLRLTTGVTTLNSIHSEETLSDGYGPRLILTWSVQPRPPHALNPDGGQRVGGATPVFTWNVGNANSDTEQDQYKIQVDDDLAFGSPAWDPGFVASPDESATYAGSALTAGTTYYWRLQFRDLDGRQSDYSPVASFIYDTKGALTITNPAAPANNFVEEITPPIAWTFTGETQRQFRVLLYRLVLGDYELIHDSGRIASAATSYTIPERDPESRDRLIRKVGTSEYRVIVRIWDTKDRVATPGDTIWVEATRDFEFRRSATPTATTSLVATEYDAHAVQLEWQRATFPDFWSLIVDDDRVRGRLDPVDTFISGTTHRYIWRGAEPLKTHTYEVEAVVNSGGVLKHSQGNATTTFRLVPTGIWIVDEDRNTPVKMLGRFIPRLDIGSEETIFAPIGKQAPVLVRQTVRGYEGTVEGDIRRSSTPNLSAKDYLDNLFVMKKKTMDRELRLIMSANRINVPVIIGKITVSPLPEPTQEAGGSGYHVAVEVAQTGKFPT